MFGKHCPIVKISRVWSVGQTKQAIRRHTVILGDRKLLQAFLLLFYRTNDESWAKISSWCLNLKTCTVFISLIIIPKGAFNVTFINPVLIFSSCWEGKMVLGLSLGGLCYSCKWKLTQKHWKWYKFYIILQIFSRYELNKLQIFAACLMHSTLPEGHRVWWIKLRALILLKLSKLLT